VFLLELVFHLLRKDKVSADVPADAPSAVKKIQPAPMGNSNTVQTQEMFITTQEMNGTAHELGWFKPETSIGEIKKQTSEKMCVPSEAIKLASSSSISSGSTLSDDTPLKSIMSDDTPLKSTLSDDTLSSGSTPLKELVSPSGPTENLSVVVQMPESFQEALDRVDDIRVHEDTYNELVKFACQFEDKSVTSANICLLHKVVQLVCASLHAACHNLSRGWAIEALDKLLRHTLKQLRKCNESTGHGSQQAASFEKLESIKEMIAEALLEVSQNGYWQEQYEARHALAQLDTLKLDNGYKRPTADEQRRACLGGA